MILISSDFWVAIFCCISVYFLTLLSLPFIKSFALKSSLVEINNIRSHSEIPRVRLGGVAILFSVLICFYFFVFFTDYLNEGSKELILIFRILLASFFIFLVGFIDDIVNLSPFKRLTIQFIISLLICKFGLLVESINISFFNKELINNFDIPISISYFLSFLWLSGLTNAFNWIDGLDGLASGIGIISCIGLVIINISYGNFLLAFLSLLLVFSLLGFLKYNFYPSTIYMGDGGSNFLGFILASISLVSTPNNLNTVNPFLLISIFFIPVFDMALVIMLRVKAKQSPFFPDKRHIHHRILNAGLSHKMTVLIIYAIAQFVLCLSLFLILKVLSIYIVVLSGIVLIIFLNIYRRNYLINIKNKNQY